MDLSIIVVSWNTRDLLRRCLTLVQETSHDLRYEVVVVDNGSVDGSVDLVQREFPWVRLIANSDNRGFARANNQGIAASTGRHVLLLNSDAMLQPGAVTALVTFLDEHPEVGIVGARLLNPDGSFQGSYADFPSLLSEFLLLTGLSRWVCPSTFPSYPAEQSDRERAVDWVFGACLMARRSAIEAVGMLDEDYFMYTEETDWCFRMRCAGWSVAYLPWATVVHWSGRSSDNAPERKRSQLYRSKWLFVRKHRGAVAAGLFYLTIWSVSLLKLAVWALNSVVARGDQRHRAWLRVRSYRLLLSEL